MRILITGASSYVGARIYLDLRDKYDVVGTYNKNRLSKDFVKLDITDRDETLRVVKDIKPDLIIHVAANPNARWCEANPDACIELNATGTKNVVDAADAVDAKVIYISSLSAMVPTIYGKSKLAGEKFVEKAKAGFVILRPALIIGFSPNTTSDRPFNRLLKNLDEGMPAVYDTSWRFQPTWLGHISEVIQMIIKKDITGETIPIAVPEFKNRFEVARDILSHFDVEVTPKDLSDTTPVITVKQDKLKELGLPAYDYSEILAKIIKEIEQREKFILSAG